MHFLRAICHVLQKKTTLLQDNTHTFPKVSFCAKMSVAMKSLTIPLVCKELQKVGVF